MSPGEPGGLTPDGSRKDVLMFDLGPAVQEMTRLVGGVRDDQLDAPTPCLDWTVADLLAHVHQFASVFTDNARKQPPQPPTELVDEWRDEIPRQLDDLAAAWREDSAWDGRVSAGGIEMDAADNALVAIEELTIHGWDLALATGQDFKAGEVSLDHVEGFFEAFADALASGDGPFGPATTPPAGASRLDVVVARTGRDVAWGMGG